MLDPKTLQSRFEFPPNSRRPVPIDSDLFSGHGLLLLRPQSPSDDPLYYDRMFQGRARKWEFQVQGRFKRKPEGVIYFGVQAGMNDKLLSLGLLTKSVSRAALSFSQRLNPAMHYSFGGNGEIPHMAFPLFTSMDEFVACVFDPNP
jgi:hypothetical protein